MREREDFLWTVEVHGLWYGTSRQVIIDGLMARGHCSLLVLTPDVLPILRDFAKKSGHAEQVRSIYVLSPEPVALRARLVARGSDGATLGRRLEDCINWDDIACSSDLYDFFIPGEGDVELNARRVVDGLAILKVDDV